MTLLARGEENVARLTAVQADWSSSVIAPGDSSFDRAPGGKFRKKRRALGAGLPYGRPPGRLGLGRKSNTRAVRSVGNVRTVVLNVRTASA